MHNEQDLKNTPEYRSGMFRIVTCPVCGYPTLDMYWICEHCGWEYDIELQTEDEESPCNGMSLRAYRELYKTGGISINVTICSRKAAEELLRTDTGRAAAPPAPPRFWSISTAPASPSLPTTAITPTKWCITRSWTH